MRTRTLVCLSLASMVAGVVVWCIGFPSFDVTFSVGLVLFSAGFAALITIGLENARRRSQIAVRTSREDQLVKRQQHLGEQAYQAICQAALENETHCQQHGDAGPMRVTKLPQNGGVYSVFVYLSGTNGWYGGRENTMYFALQFNVSTRDNRVYALLGSYGPSEECTLENFDAFLARICAHVRGWRLYHREAA